MGRQQPGSPIESPARAGPTPTTARKLPRGDTLSVPAQQQQQQQQQGRLRSVAACACRPPINRVLAESTGKPKLLTRSAQPAQLTQPQEIFRSFPSPSVAETLPVDALPTAGGSIRPRSEREERKSQEVNHERRGGLVVAEPGRAALHPGGAAAGRGLLAAVVGPCHHHRLVPRPLVPRAQPARRDGGGARHGRPPARRPGRRRRGPLLRRPARGRPRRRRGPAARRQPQDR